MQLPSKLTFPDLIGKRILITGAVRTGKTKLTVDLLEEAVALGYSKDITVVDMAPETEVVEGRSIGGRLSELTEAYQEVRYLAPDKVETPRLKAISPDHLLLMVQMNAERIKPLLEAYLTTPSPVLFVNDVSIYLQSGSLEIILKAARESDTFIANGYYGEFFSQDHGTDVSEIERDLMDQLASHMDEIFKLTSQQD